MIANNNARVIIISKKIIKLEERMEKLPFMC